MTAHVLGMMELPKGDREAYPLCHLCRNVVVAFAETSPLKSIGGRQERILSVTNHDYERPAAVIPMKIMAATVKEQVRSRKIFLVCHHLVLADVTLAKWPNSVAGIKRRRAENMLAMHSLNLLRLCSQVPPW